MKRKITIAGFLMLIILLIPACADKEKENKDNKDNNHVVLGKYKGIEVSVVRPETITEADVEEEIRRILNDSQGLEGVTEKAVEEGDLVNIDYEGYLEGEAIPESSIADYNVLIGSGIFFDGAESQLIGALPGETKEINVTFPEEYPDPDLAGQTAVYKVTINSIQIDEVPELTDEFVRSISDCETVADFRQEVFDMLEAAAESTVENDKVNDIWSQVMKNAEITDYPEDVIKEVIADYKAIDEELAELYDTPFEEYINTYLGYTIEAYEERARHYAEEVVGGQMVVAEIAKAEGLNADQITDAEMELCAANNGYDSIEAYQEDYAEEEIRQEVLYYRVIDFVTAAAIEVEG